MSKLKYVNIHNLVYLSGLNPTRAANLASVIDDLLGNILESSDQNSEDFNRWYRKATFSRFTQENINFSFRAYQWISPEGKVCTLCGVDRTPTSGGFGYPRRGAYVYYYLATPEGQEIISFPLVYILRKHGTFSGHYILYEHGAVNYVHTGHDLIRTWTESATQKIKGIYVPMPAEPHGQNGLIYVGITSRPWAIRYKEHLRNAASGSNLPFHVALREKFGTCNTRFHYVLSVLPNKAQAEQAEEEVVEKRSLFPLGLNAIPGGKAGIRYLAALNALNPNRNRTTESTADFIDALTESSELEDIQLLASLQADLLRRLSNRGSVNSNVMISFWSDDENASRMITSRSDRLSVEQIRNARYAASLGLSAEEIQASIGARNIDIVKRLLEGKTYSRVPT